MCDFGIDPGLLICDWKNRNGSALKWELGAGTLSNWLGGPPTDAGLGNDAERGQRALFAFKLKLIFFKCFSIGGYIFFETSLLAAPVVRVDEITIREGQNAFIESPVLGSTGAEGKCISFR